MTPDSEHPPDEALPSSTGTNYLLVVGTLVAAAWLAPLAGYWLWTAGVETVTPDQAEIWLTGPDRNQYVLVDVRPAEVHLQGHIQHCVNWPMPDLLAADRRAVARRGWQSKHVLVVSGAGIEGVRAVRHLRQAGLSQCVNIRGGVQEWIWAAAESPRWRQGETVEPPPFRQSSPWEQCVSVVAFFVIKPFYTLLSMLVIAALWESRRRDMRALFWAAVFFFWGELACAVNVLAFVDRSYVLEYVHSVGMTVCWAFVMYAMLEAFDQRLLHISDSERRCAALSLCGQCIKYHPVPCGLQRLFYVIIVVCAAAAFLLLTADWHDESFNTRVVGALYHHGHLRIFQVFENWFCGGAAIGLFALTVVALRFVRDPSWELAKIFFAAGCGALGFGLLRCVLGGLYSHTRAYYGFWEETTEWLFFAALIAVLWIFRRALVPHWAERLRDQSRE